MSRPKKPIGTHLAITAIRMPPQVKVKLEKLSKETGLAQQEHIRRALDAYFFDLQAKGLFVPPNVLTPRPQRPRIMPEQYRAMVERERQEQPRRRIFRRPGSVGTSA